MSTIVKSGSSSDLLTVNTNKEALVNLPTDVAQAGFAAVVAQVDAGAVTGSVLNRALEANEDFALRVGVDNLLWGQTFNGTSVNNGEWYQDTDTCTIAQANGFITLNNNGTTTNSKYAALIAYKSAPLYGTQSTYVQFRASVENPDATNKIGEMGAYFANTGMGTATDGAFFRWKSDGTLVGVVVHSSSETPSSAFTAPTTATVHYYCIVWTWAAVEFWIDDVLQARVATPNTTSQTTRSSGVPVQIRMYNTGGAASAAFKINVGAVQVTHNGAPLSRPYSHARVASGENCNNGVTSWSTLGTQSNWTNSPTTNSATLANNAVPSGGYTGTTLGGLFAFPATATANTDLIVFAYQVPAGSASVTAKTLFVTDIRIDCVNTGATVAGTPTIMHWFAAFGSSTATLATTDSATAKAPRKVPLGSMGWVIGDLAGKAGYPINLNLNTPIPVYAGQYLHIGQQTNVGTATGSQVFRGSVMVNGYWE